MKTYTVWFTVNGEYKSATVKARTANEAKATVRKAHNGADIHETECTNDWGFMN